MFKTLPLPEIASVFQTDESFGLQRVAGPNPMLIKKITQLPDNFPVTDEGYKKVMGDGDSLQQALADNRIYLLDYQELSLLVEHPGNDNKQVFAPLALFALPEGGSALKPVAIQCGQAAEEFKVSYAVTTDEGQEYWEWLVAKTVVQMAEGNYHELFVHLARTHLLIEAFAVATPRHLAEKHPLNILLTPHFEGTLSINASAAGSLIAADGPIDNIFAADIKYTQQAAGEDRLGYDFYDSMLPNDLEKRGVASTEQLPNYPYRDDATLVWNAIHEWVNEYIGVYYKSDNDVLDDTELTAWTDALIAEGKVKGFKAITSKTQLADVVTMVVFTASAQHAAVNFPQSVLMPFAPAISGAVWGNDPLTANSEEAWLKMLAPMPQSLEQLSLLHLLGSVYYRQLGEYRSNHFPYLAWFEDDKITDSGGPLDRFNEALEKVETTIKERNANRPEYSYLLPSKIPPSINI